MGSRVTGVVCKAVFIQVRDIKSALLVPNKAIEVGDGKRVVYVLSEDVELSTVEVRLGASSGAFCEVVGGDLQEGGVIVVDPPAPRRGLSSPFYLEVQLFVLPYCESNLRQIKLISNLKGI